MWLFNKMPAHLPRATGPYEPGCIDIQVGFSKDGLFLRLYYPTNKRNREEGFSSKWCPSIPDCDYEAGMASVLMIYPLFIRLMYWKAGKPYVPVQYGDKIYIDDKIKLIIMSHGLGAFRGFHNSVLVELASRGYLVAILEHRDESAAFTYYYNGKEDQIKGIKTPIKFKHVDLGKEHYSTRNNQVHSRSEECCRALDFFLDVNNGKVPEELSYEQLGDSNIDFKIEDLIGKIDLNNLVMMGHSFGGATALLTMSKRSEFRCGILLDPWMFPIKNEDIVDKIKIPLIFINTQTFHVAANVKVMEKYLKKQTEMYTILQTTHENQTDSVFIVGYWLNWFMRKIDPILGLRINNFLLARFLKEKTGQNDNIEDCQRYLNENQQCFTEGLTKPWA